MTEPSEKQHARALFRLGVAVLTKQGWSTREISNRLSTPLRTIQVYLKDWKERKYRSLYSCPIVEEDKLLNGKLCGVTRYSWETKSV